MLDHVVPAVANYTGPISLLPEPAKAWIRKAEQDSGTRVAYVGTGPDTVAGSM
jgi:adenylosuccinate synthase